MKKEIELATYSCPHVKLTGKIKNLMRGLARNFGKNPALYCQPNITMRSGLMFPEDKQDFIINNIKKEFSKIKKPLVKINGINEYNGTNIFTIQLEIKKSKNKLSS